MGKQEHTILELKTDEEVKVVTDPYRSKIMDVYSEKKVPMTVKQVADELGEVPAKIHYHVKKLIAIDVLELAKTKEVNGIIAKYYKYKYDYIRVNFANLSSKVYAGGKEIIENTFSKYADMFKDDIMLHIENIKQRENESNHPQLLIHKNKLYMTIEEHASFMKEIKTLLKKYSEEGEGREEYSSIVGAIRIK